MSTELAGVGSNPAQTLPGIHDGDPINADATQEVVSIDAVAEQEMIDYLVNVVGLSPGQAKQLLSTMTPQQSQTLYALVTGKDDITRQEAMERFGLSSSEYQMLFGKNQQVGVFDNPFSDIFLFFLMYSYALGADIKLLMSQMLQSRYEHAIDAAAEKLKGAQVQFACAMVAGMIGLAFAGFSLWKIGHMYPRTPGAQPDTTPGADTLAGKLGKIDDLPKGRASDPNAPGGERATPGAAQDNDGNRRFLYSQWLSPYTAQLFSGPLTAGGQFGEQTYQYQASLLEAEVQKMEALYKQLEDHPVQLFELL